VVGGQLFGLGDNEKNKKEFPGGVGVWGRNFDDEEFEHRVAKKDLKTFSAASTPALERGEKRKKEHFGSVKSGRKTGNGWDFGD